MLVYFNFWCESIVIIVLCSWAKRTLQSLVECTETRGMVPFKTSRQVFFKKSFSVRGWDDFIVPLTMLFLHCTHSSSGWAADFLFSESSCGGMAGLLCCAGVTAGKAQCLARSSRRRHAGTSQHRQSCQQSVAHQSALLCRVRVFFLMLKHKMSKEAYQRFYQCSLFLTADRAY